MKKTFISLLALAGMASAAVEGNWTANFTTSDQTKDQTYTDYTAIFPAEGCPLTLSFTGLTTGGTNAGGTYGKDGNSVGDAGVSFIRPNANICANTSDTYTLTFKLTNNSDNSIIIQNIAFESFFYNAGGNDHSAINPTTKANYTLTLNTNNTTLGTKTEGFTNGATKTGDDWSLTVDFSLDEAPITLESKQYCELSLTLSKSEGNGSYVGLSGASFSVAPGPVTPGIPEPTTATLSLLALCGLAARRRRK